ncbi:LysR substrate-binding domain-containing protein [Variovorax sp. HW608]|uniref:LysR substrate-binding domain-containing protein n=1 Tax=Variovorax sp. HW608 TaxID=1034889 RepID=UPI0012FD4A7F|nr:LysR substrate-binding domain-containing protein [Variovorax sp. HW608]
MADRFGSTVFVPLFEERRVCLMRRDHPLAKKKLRLTDLAEMRFISTVNMLGRDNDLDDLLKQHGLPKRKFPVLPRPREALSAALLGQSMCKVQATSQEPSFGSPILVS